MISMVKAAMKMHQSLISKKDLTTRFELQLDLEDVYNGFRKGNYHTT